MRLTLQELRSLVVRLVESDAGGTVDTSRLTISYSVKGQRMYVDSRLKQPDWLEKVHVEMKPDEPAVYQVVDFQGDEAYLNRMDVYGPFRSKGYGPEVMSAVLRLLKQMGFKTARGYIEHENYASQRMMKKVGAEETDQREHGSYWTIDLARLT